MSALTLTLRHAQVEQRVFWRNRSGVFFSFALPLMLLVFFGAAGDSDYERVLVPGIAALVVVSVTFQALAISLAFHREQGVLKQLMASPLPVSSLIGARMLSAALVAALEVGIVVLGGRFIYGLGWPHQPLTLIVAVTVGALCFGALAFAVTAAIPSGDAAPAVTNAIYLPLMFVSGVFYEIEAMPRALEIVAQVLPLHHLVAPVRAAFLGNDAALAFHLAVLCAWGIAGAVYAARRFRWEPAFER